MGSAARSAGFAGRSMGSTGNLVLSLTLTLTLTLTADPADPVDPADPADLAVDLAVDLAANPAELFLQTTNCQI